MNMPLLTLTCVLETQQVICHSSKWNYNGIVATLMQHFLILCVFWEVFTELSGLIMVLKWAHRVMKCEILFSFFSPYIKGKHNLSQHTFWNFQSKINSASFYLSAILDCFIWPYRTNSRNIRLYNCCIFQDIVICFTEYAEDWH